ncbi:MAG: hypothetical protein ACOYMA_00430 [Bacteroidia bacterium]
MNKITINKIKSYINNKFNAICLNDIYINQTKKLIIKCVNGHIFESTWFNIRYNNIWCKVCNNIPISPTIEFISNYVNDQYNGKCLSPEYINAHHNLIFSCSKNHIWKAKWKHIYNSKSWCPICSSSYGETVCRCALEQIFGYKFNKIKPEFLINPKTNRKLELDGFCKELNIAFEHQGRQHYQIVDLYKMNDDILKKQQLRDFIKRTECEKRNIKIIYFNEINKKVTEKELLAIIKNELIRNNITLPDNFDNIKLDFRTVWNS